MKDKEKKTCIPGRRSQGKPISPDTRRDKRRSRIEIMFARPKDWRRVADGWDRCPMFCLSAVAIGSTVMFWF